MTEHNCVASMVERFATYEEPFHFVDSGLPNVYLIGIKYFVCEKCGEIVAEIPAIKQLMTVIARDLVESNSSLTSDEARFLRKRLGKKASDFAKELGITPDHLSRLENDRLTIPESLDKLIRLVYAVSADDPQLLRSVMRMVQSWLITWTKRTTQKVIMKKIDDNQWSNVALAA